MTIEELRMKIDEIDDEMRLLFERRMELAEKIGQYKKENNLPILDEARENNVISHNVAKLKDIGLKEDYTDFQKKVMELSRKRQEDSHETDC